MNSEPIKFPKDLPNFWKTYDNTKIIKFYSNKDENNYPEFSNFYRHESFEFEIPKDLHKEGYPNKVNCTFSEKAIMLCKAILFDDHPNFTLIEHCDSPSYVKKYGRQVKNFNQFIWNKKVLDIAYQVVFQKFSKVKNLRNILLGTGDYAIAESTSKDINWGTGCDIDSRNSNKPSKWPGFNILGWALMKARNDLTQGKESETELENDVFLTFNNFDPFKDAGSRELKEKIHIR